jgi:glutamyl-tRNA synthetase
MVNYLARLGWSHGDEELFEREQLIGWFDGQHLARSPAQWDAAKLNWVNAHRLKQLNDAALAALVLAQLKQRGIEVTDEVQLSRLCALYKDRCATTGELADWLRMYFESVAPSEQDLAAHVTAAVHPGLSMLAERLAGVEWTKSAIAGVIKETLAASGLKMPQLAHAVRVLVCGRTQTPSLDAVLESFSRDVVIARLSLA